MKCLVKNLPNRIRVITVPLEGRRSVSVGIWTAVGGRDEPAALSGASHFLEHMVFKGTRSRTAVQIKEAVEGVGGSLNAFTGEEYTCFFAKAPSRHLDSVFEVLADMTLEATLRQEDLDKERGVILEEIKMSQDQPSQLADEFLAGLLWPGHALGRPIAGTLETVGRMTRSDLVLHRDRFYKPPFITLVASGDVTSGRFEALAESAFGSLDGGAEAERMPLFEPAAPIEKRLCAYARPTEQSHLAIGFRAFGKDHRDEFALDLLNVILGGNMSSRLFNEVREERGLAYDIGSSVRKYHETGSFEVSAGVDNRKIGESIRVILGELEKVAARPVPEDELRRAKDFFLGQMELGLENSMNNMLWAGENYVSFGRLRTPEEIAERVERVEAPDLTRVAEELFDRRSAHLAVVGPEADRLTQELAEAFDKNRP